MKRYIYVLEYENPGQQKNNKLFGWDEKDKEILIIEAIDKEKALEWGEKLAKKFLAVLYGSEKLNLNYHSQIEEYSFNTTPAALKNVPVVLMGTYLDFEEMLLKKYGQEMDLWRQDVKSSLKNKDLIERKYFLYAGIIVLIIIILLFMIARK